tara:strand:- start:2927 stop:5320 length:2394 start_codon:yes stop_codon:yes gene_type:complete
MFTAKLKEKRWNKELEKPVYEEWEKKGTYKFNKNSKKKVYSIDTPPPYVNTPVHIGQVTTYCLMDMFARFHRMKGREILFPLGLDRNGLPIEMAAERKYKLDFTNVKREDYLKACRKVLEETSMESVESFLRCGIGFNSWEKGVGIGEVYETDSEDYRSLTQDTFIDLWGKGLIYEAERINNFCPGCQTTIADSEIEYKEISSAFNDIVFKVKETGEKLVIGTTRPELVCTCGMVIFHPDDKRYKHLDGKTAVTPIFNKEIPIKAHPMAVMDKGTGLVMMCSAGDLSDIRFFREQRIDPVIAINKDGAMNHHAGFLECFGVKEARQKMVEALKKEKLLVKEQKISHRTPICERSKDEIEFIAMKEFYLKQLEFKKDMKRMAKELNFYSPKSRQILIDWINSVSIDWPISRRRYYATEIPLWYCESCDYIYVPKKGKYYRPWKEKPLIKECPKCKGHKFRGEERVFDTWFDSSISPLYILKYSRDDKFFKKNNPCSLRPQGKEIVRTWLYYTLLKDYLLTGKTIFEDAWVNYHIVDEKGHKMSKSLGNIIDPRKALDRYGAEPFRLWAVVEGNLDRTDFRCSFERIEGAGKTVTKLWNVSKFISMFPKPSKGKLLEADKWIISELNALIEETEKGYSNYDFHNPVVKIKSFIWETFSSHYLELVKARAYNQEGKFSKEESDGARWTLYYCLENLLKLLAPVIPLMTFKIYRDLWKGDIHFEDFPKVSKKVSVGFKGRDLMELNSKIWKAKKDKGKGLRDSIGELYVNNKFKKLEKDLKACHGAEDLSYGNFKVVLDGK